MAYFYELQGIGNQLGTESVTLTFALWNDAAEGVPALADVRTWWAANAPSSFGVVLTLDQTDVNDLSPLDYKATATYKKWTEPDTGGDEWSFEIGTQDATVTHSLQTVSSHTVSGTAPDFKRAINVTRDGVQGQAVPKPVSSFVKTYYMAPSAFTLSYRAALVRAVGRINSASFDGFDAYEVLLSGVSGSQRGRDNMQLTARFDVSENETGLSVGPITGIDKKGWDLLWVLNKEEKDDTAKKTVKVPVAAYVERVFKEMDFASTLGL